MSEKADMLKNLKLLYVEDESEHRDQLNLFLKRRVGKLITATNGQEGLRAFLEETPDIIITDLRMPEMSGIEMSQNIRVQDKFCPIIITTAFSDVETILEAIDKGIDKYIIKPIDTDELLATLEVCAQKIAENKEKAYSTGDNLKEKKEYENAILKEMAHFVKKQTGKGPQYVKVFITPEKVEVEIFDPFTVIEKTLLENPKNVRLVSFFRDAFYKDRKKDLQTIIQNIISKPCRLEGIQTNIYENKDVLIFRIS